MKKRVLLMIVLASTSLFALAQSNVGDWSLMPKLGLNLATMTNDDDTKFRPAFVAGAEVEYVATSQFLVSFGALYSQQGCEGKADGYDATIKLDYINVPLLAHYRVIDKFAIKAGLQLGFLINDKIKASGNGVSAEVGLEDTFKAAGIDVKVNSIDLSIPIGLSYEFKNIQIEGRYNWGMTKILSGGGIDPTKNSVIQFTVGYKFGL